MMMEHRGIRWGYVFLRASSYLKPDEFNDLMVQAVEMYLGGESERKVKQDNFEGRLITEGRYELMGSLGGQRFDAELETVYGHDQATFLVNEQTSGAGAPISVN